MINIWKPLGILGLIAIYTFGVYSCGSSSGAADVQKDWDDAKNVQDKAISDLKLKYSILEREHEKVTGEIENDLQRAKQEYDAALAAQQSQFAKRLLQSESRADIYKRQAQGSVTERRDLASHAARLDSSLEEGRRLVEELRRTLELRDRQLRSLGAQITADRKLLE